MSSFLLFCVKNWLKGRAQSVVVNGPKSGSWMVTKCAPQDSVLEPGFFNMFIDVLDASVKFTIINFADDTKMVGAAD